MKVFGSFYEDGGVPFDSYEAAEQFVRLRKSGWKIINDGQLSQKCIHLTRREGWGKLVEGKGLSMMKTLIKRLLGMAHYYFMKTPKRPVHEMIRAGDIKLALKITYWIALPYVVLLFVLTCHLWWALLYVLPSLIIYAYETNGLSMKFITPFVQILRWVLVAHGYALLLLRKLIGNLRGLV
jgi:hypothetical protein